METANTEKKGISKNLIIIIVAVVVAIIATTTAAIMIIRFLFMPFFSVFAVSIVPSLL